MASFIGRLRSFAPLLVAWLGFTLPVAPQRVEAPPLAASGLVAASIPGDASSLISTLGVGRQPVPIHRIAAVGELRSVDIDADGRPDLVATGRGGIRTFLNIGSGRFVEHSATRTILRHHSAPGFTARERSDPHRSGGARRRAPGAHPHASHRRACDRLHVLPRRSVCSYRRRRDRRRRISRTALPPVLARFPASGFRQ